MAPLRLLRPHGPHDGSEKGNERPIESLEQRLDREGREGREARERARIEAVAEREREDADAREPMSSELLDVPAAVVCLVCGMADCTGCEEQDQSRSGIVAIIAWERPGLTPWQRLWSTARSTTRDAETFFELMPDGPVTPALRFAAACELIAVSAMFVSFLAVAAVVAPGWLAHVVRDPHARSIAARIVVLGIPAFASLLVLAHAVHGLAIDAGAVKNGARRARTRALRFGLYACGWDLVLGPFGAVVVAMKEGVRAAFGVLDTISVHGPSTQAFLRGCYRLDGERASKARSSAALGVAVTTVVAALAMIAGLVALVLA